MCLPFSRFFSLLSLGLLLFAQQHAHASAAASSTILILGDSLSSAFGMSRDAGWTTLLQNKISAQGLHYQLINVSVSGDTSRTGLGRLTHALQQHQPAIVIVALGGNDGLRGLPFTEIESSLAGIIKTCQQQQARVLLAGVRLPPNYGPVYNQRFAELYLRLAQRYAVPLIPQLLADVSEHRHLMQNDGIHPTAEAQAKIMQNVWVKLEPML
jgi:acyl-CoA thioesterase-1